MKWEIWRNHAGKILADLQNIADGEQQENITLFLLCSQSSQLPGYSRKDPAHIKGTGHFGKMFSGLPFAQRLDILQHEDNLINGTSIFNQYTQT